VELYLDQPGILLLFAISAYRTLLFVYIILQLLQSLADLRIPDPLRPALNFVYDVCEPFLRLFRGLLPAVRMGGMGLDLSPLIAFLVLFVVERIVASAVL
jgi:YggT family protein